MSDKPPEENTEGEGSTETPDPPNTYRVLKYAAVTESVEPTGATTHTVGGVLIGPAAALAIVEYLNDGGFGLLYLDANDQYVTDTWHASVESALDQAAFEYEGLRWRDVVE